MLTIYAIASPDRGLAWLIWALIAFLLISAAVGAAVGSQVFRAGAPGALQETEDMTPAPEENPSGHAAGH